MRSDDAGYLSLRVSRIRIRLRPSQRLTFGAPLEVSTRLSAFRNRDSGYSTKHDRICLICADVGDAPIQRVERVAVAHMMATLG